MVHWCSLINGSLMVNQWWWHASLMDNSWSIKLGYSTTKLWLINDAHTGRSLLSALLPWAAPWAPTCFSVLQRTFTTFHPTHPYPAIEKGCKKVQINVINMINWYIYIYVCIMMPMKHNESPIPFPKRGQPRMAASDDQEGVQDVTRPGDCDLQRISTLWSSTRVRAPTGSWGRVMGELIRTRGRARETKGNSMISWFIVMFEKTNYSLA